MDTIVGVMYCKNEIDVLPVTIPEALKHVDTMFISDDGSIDGSWELIQSFKQQYPDKIEHIQQQPDPFDQGQRTAMLVEIQKRYKAENTWVQVIEADMVLHTIDLRGAISSANRNNISVDWAIMNAVRPYWEGIHHLYPNWPVDIRTLMPMFHYMENILYTYRPLPALYFEPGWRPFPRGFGVYYDQHPPYAKRRRSLQSRKRVPLALHYGYRGPTHEFVKHHRGQPLDNEAIEHIFKTSGYYNGGYNRAEHLTTDDPKIAWRRYRDSKR